MIVKLKGNLDFDLTRLDLKEGDEVGGRLCPVSKVGAFHFTVSHKSGFAVDCVVWPENYEVKQQN